MARIFITGSSDGLGAYVANRLVKSGHNVVLHARNAQRANDARKACPGAESVVTGDLSSFKQTKALAEEVNRIGGEKGFDAVVYNAGIFRGGFRKTEDGVPALMAVNTFSTYMLSCLIKPVPERVVFLSSGLHSGGDGKLGDLEWKERGEKRWSDGQAYGDSKLHNVMFAKAFARRWGEGRKANSMDPGWVATKMGGSGASGSWEASADTYEWLSTGVESTGGYWKPGKKEGSPVRVADDEGMQEELLRICERVTGVKVPGS